MCSTTHVTTDSLLLASVTFLTVKSNNFPHNNDCDVEMCNTKKLQKRKYIVLAEFGVKMKVKVKVKCTLLQALRLCTGRTAHRGGGRGLVLLFHDHGTGRG
jgi:hypothetical protein